MSQKREMMNQMVATPVSASPAVPAPGMAAPVLSVEHLCTAFRVDDGWKPIVRDVSFDVGAGETVAIVGESGSGKSVTSLSIMRLLPAASSRIAGRIRLGDVDLGALSEREMRRVRGNDIAMIFQDPMTSLNPIFTIGDQIAETLVRHRGLSRGAALRQAVELLEKVRIPNAKARAGDYPHQFSGGMRQRAMIAMAIATRPKLLIADEPTTALDVTIQGQILDLIRTLQREEGMSVLFVTHDMGVVAEIADRTLVMYRGEAVEWDRTAAIFAASRHPYTRALLSAIPRLGSMQGRSLPARFEITDVATGAPRPVAPMTDTVAHGTTPVLEVRNLTTRFDIRSGLFGRKTGAVHAVENVSFDLRRGEILSLVGESGCGKSTTGRSIIRLTEARRGRVSVEGYVNVDGYDALGLNVTDLRRMRRSIQMIFQDPYASLNPRKRIRATLTQPFVEQGLGSKAAALDKAADLLERVACRSMRWAACRTSFPAASASASRSPGP
ncbi:Glutathione import ATP-binding protein GsiA [Methylobrevis pamukkalensis]|uniref:Glutathione import ATP-binding protein GsiA n=1 Tax=Methylobrevis pamukkalensis TaxID=1439726 RepID=A0A1E3H6K1_9HYPH|nr:Glutathione import ATP-binding protein GsiA [Methylobrevis pamukkalensis]